MLGWTVVSSTNAHATIGRHIDEADQVVGVSRRYPGEASIGVPARISSRRGYGQAALNGVLRSASVDGGAAVPRQPKTVDDSTRNPGSAGSGGRPAEATRVGPVELRRQDCDRWGNGVCPPTELYPHSDWADGVRWAPRRCRGWSPGWADGLPGGVDGWWFVLTRGSVVLWCPRTTSCVGLRTT